MRITLITEFFPTSDRLNFSGGVETRTYYIYFYLAKSNLVSVVSRNRKYLAATSWSIVPRLWFMAGAIFKSILLPCDIIEGSNFICYLPAWVAAKLKGVPAVAWFADVYQPVWFREFFLPAAIFGWLSEWLALKLPWDKVIAMSQTTKEKLVSAGVSSDKIEVVYGGVEVEKLRNLTVKKYDRPTVCTIARLVNYKRIEDLLSALAIIKRKIPRVQLVVIGEGPERKNFEKLTKEFNVTNRVKFMGELEHGRAMKILKKSHVFSLPSVVEGFGLVTVEAMACGVPYVNSRIAVTEEITDGGKGGILVKPLKSGEIAKGIIQLLLNKNLYSAKRREGLMFCRRYDWKRIVQKTLNVYRSVTNV